MAKKVHVTATLIENEDGEILSLLRNVNGAEGGTWGLVGGGIEEDEENDEAALREIWEEIGMKFDADRIKFLETFHWDRTDLDITLEAFKIKVNNDEMTVKIDNNEAIGYRWIKPEEAYRRTDLMKGFYPILEKVYGLASHPL